jgi:ribonuclease HI
MDTQNRTIIMRQKIVIRAIIKDQHGRVLLLRRRGGRESIAGKFELPGGKMIVGEQPGDTLPRTLKYHTNLTPKTRQLFDVISYVDPDDRRTQYLFIVYLTTVTPIGAKISLDAGYDKYIWKTKQNLQQDVVTNSTAMLLGLNDNIRGKHGSNNEKFIIYTDGASRGNPGQSAAGFIIFDYNGDAIVEGGQFLGAYDGLFAEYAGIALALQKAKSLGLKNIEIRSDNLSVVNQINGVHEVTDSTVGPIYDHIKQLESGFKSVRFVHIRRKFNQLADGVVNKILDQS